MGNILHVTKQSVSKWERGENIPEPSILKQLANMFNCSTDYLLGTTDIKNHPDNLSTDDSKLNKNHNLKLNEKDEKDIEKRVAEIKKGFLENQEGLMLSGNPVSEEAVQSIIDALEFGMRQAKVINKKYTPKKYRKDNE